MTPQRSILFVCTGNVFRSVAAEFCFKKYISDSGSTSWKVGSAGILAEEPALIDPKVIETLQEFGIDATGHKVRRLTQDILDDYDLVVGMAENHIDFMKSVFNYRSAVLFNELAVNEKTSIWDVENEVPNYKNNRTGVEEKIERTIRQIHAGIPSVFKKLSELH